MKPFQKNKAGQISSIFDDCTYRPLTHPISLDRYGQKLLQKFRERQQLKDEYLHQKPDMSDAATPQLQDIVNKYSSDCFFIESESYEDEYTDNDEDDMPKDHSFHHQKQQPAPAIPQGSSDYKKSSLQIIEDHLLSKVYIRRLYGAIYLYNGRHYVPLTEQDYLILLRRESNEGILSILKTYRAYSDGYRFLVSNPDIEFGNYDAFSIRFKTFIAFENTLLDARTNQKYEHNPGYPVFFGINAHYFQHPAETPYWDAFLETTSQGDKKTKDLIYEMLGYLMLQGNDGKCFFVLATAPNSGKILLGDFIGSLFPDCFVSHMAIDDFGDRFSLGGLWKTTINVSMDLPQSTLSAHTVSLIKTLTGDTKITAEEKYMPKCTALNRLNLIFGTNSKIAISVPDQAFWNRMVIVPFLYEVPRKNRNTALLSHLLSEKDSILSKSIPYVSKLISRNYEFSLPDTAAVMKQEWSGCTRDLIENYFSEYCIFTNDASGIPATELFEHFQEYCKSQFSPCIISRVANFSKALIQKFPDVKKCKRRMAGYDNPISVFENIAYSDKHDKNL